MFTSASCLQRRGDDGAPRASPGRDARLGETGGRGSSHRREGKSPSPGLELEGQCGSLQRAAPSASPRHWKACSWDSACPGGQERRGVGQRTQESAGTRGALSCEFCLFKILFTGFRERRRRGRETSSNYPPPGTWPATQACALTGNELATFPFPGSQASAPPTEPHPPGLTQIFLKTGQGTEENCGAVKNNFGGSVPVSDQLPAIEGKLKTEGWHLA